MSLPPRVTRLAILGVVAALSVPLTAGSTYLRADIRAKVVKERKVAAGLRSIPTCASSPSPCRQKGKRIMVDDTDPALLQHLINKGCTMRRVHENGESALDCPVTLQRALKTRGLARDERILRASDLASATRVRAPDVWSGGTTGGNVPVAILDTGAALDHPELQPRIVAWQDFTGEGFMDGFGHGSHVSGIVAGQGTAEVDGTSVTGVSPGALLLVAKVCTNDGWCPESDILEGIEWAVSQGAKVINLSLGGGDIGTHCDFDPLAQAANSAVLRGVTVVAAAGNNGAGVGTPACGSQVIAVGAVDGTDARPAWSSMGEALDLMAPGTSILSALPCAVAGTCPDPGYARWSGTSMAAPHVTAAAALLLSIHPPLTPGDVGAFLRNHARDLGAPGFDAAYGYGLLDAQASAEALHAALCPDADGDGVTTCGNDCDDADPAAYPGAEEQCDGKDNDCNGTVDDACPLPEEPPVDREETDQEQEEEQNDAEDSATSESPDAPEDARDTDDAFSSAPEEATEDSEEEDASSSAEDSNDREEDEEEEDDDGDEERRREEERRRHEEEKRQEKERKELEKRLKKEEHDLRRAAEERARDEERRQSERSGKEETRNPSCGNGVCESGENLLSCFRDCVFRRSGNQGR